ncbi:MAG: hypothetical protein KDH17_19640 [Rhodocyclaceae bacterium]|nr:hypothetical protein [Rhodocyclaceae bacterium]
MQRSNSRRRFLRDGLALAVASAVPLAVRAAPSGAATRIFHVMSFDSPWRWTDGQFAGFKEGLDMADAEYRVFQMDVKTNSTPEAKARVGAEARRLVADWKPDLIYTSDDDALTHVSSHFAGQSLPCVFSGVNKTPEQHGIVGAPNIAGVLEQEHFVQSVTLLRQISPEVRRLAVIGDLGPQWPPVIARIQKNMARLPDCELVAIRQTPDFAGFQQAVRDSQGTADAFVQLGIFALKDENGQNVPYQRVQQWVCENSRLPDISFWIDRVFHGVLASVTVSELEQGLAAGRLARRILVDGVVPGSMPMEPTVKGHPVINLSRAEQLGINVRSSLLLSSEVVRGFQWAKPA